MSDSRTRVEVRLPENHPALIPVDGLNRQGRLIELIEKGLMYEEDDRQHYLFHDCVEAIRSLLEGSTTHVSSEQTNTSRDQVTQNRVESGLDNSLSPTKQEQALALAKSFGIDLM